MLTRKLQLKIRLSSDGFIELFWRDEPRSLLPETFCEFITRELEELQE